MKIRLHGNSIRFRLGRTEVEEFGKNGYIENRIDFFPRPFRYGLKTDDSINELIAVLKDNGIFLFVPKPWANEWIASGQVGFDGWMKTEDDQSIYLLLEKDFKCLNAIPEDQSDNFENPLMATHE